MANGLEEVCTKRAKARFVHGKLYNMRFSFSRGFTIIELLVVIAIVGILAAIVTANMSGGGARGRDAERKSDLRNLQSSIEAYKQRHGQYPRMGCTVGGDFISGENDCANYITGIDAARPFVPDFITVLPRDPRRGSNVGFAYVTNTTAGNVGTVYKAMVVNTAETETMTASSSVRSCDIGVTNSICPTTPSSHVCSPANTARFTRSYGVWGGYAEATAATPAATDALVRSRTALVICL